MSIQEIMDEIRDMPVSERERLIAMIQATLAQPTRPDKRRSLLELSGLGAEIWQEIDGQEYVNQLRDEWDHRP